MGVEVGVGAGVGVVVEVGVGVEVGAGVGEGEEEGWLDAQAEKISVKSAVITSNVKQFVFIGKCISLYTSSVTL